LSYCADFSPPWNAWDRDEIIVSDVSRSADLTTLDGTLCRLQGCESWERVLYDKEEARRRAAEMASWLISGITLIDLNMPKEELEKGKWNAEASQFTLVSVLDPKYLDLLRKKLFSQSIGKIKRVRISKFPRTDDPLHPLRNRYGRHQLRLWSTNNRELSNSIPLSKAAIDSSEP
jgi:hypothetical protein